MPSLNFWKIAQGINLTPKVSAPSSPSNGDIYYNSTLNKFQFYENGSFVELNTGSLQADGSVPLTANWNAGAFNISAAKFLAGDGLISAVGLGFSSDPDTGFFRNGSGDFLAAANSTALVRFNTTAVSFSVPAEPTTHNTYDLGSSASRWKDLWVAGTATIATATIAAATITSMPILASASTLTFQTNGSTTAGSISTAQVWTIGASASAAAHIINGGSLRLLAGASSEFALVGDSGNASSIALTGAGSSANGGVVIVYGNSHATKANIIEFNNAASNSASFSAAGIFTTVKNVGLGGASSSSVIANLGATNPLTGTNQIGANVALVGTSAATSNITGFQTSTAFGTAAAAFTVTQVTGFFANALSLGAGSTITRSVNFRSSPQTVAANNAQFADNIAFTGNWAINSTDTNPSLLSGNVSLNKVLAVGGGSPSTSAIVAVTGTSAQQPLTGTTQRGFRSSLQSTSAATVAIVGFSSAVSTDASAFTAALRAQFESVNQGKGAGSTITRDVGFYGAVPTQGTNNAFIADNNTFTGNYFINSTDTNESLISGDLRINTAGKGLLIKEGSNAKMGIDTLTAGTVVVSTTAVTANSRIFLTGQNSSGTHGELTVSARTAATSFTITSSSALDTRDIAWMIVEPA